MRSISFRLVIGTGLVLSVFVILIAVSVSWSVHQRAETARFDRLQGLIYGILGATDINDKETLSVNILALPDPRLTQNMTGLYAEILDVRGQSLWRSASTASWLPQTRTRPIGDWLFENVSVPDKPVLHRLQLSTAWQFDSGEELPFTVHVVDEADSLTRQLKRFDQTLWGSLLASAVALLLLQLWVLKLSLKPLHQIAEQVHQIERGERDSVSEIVPKELTSITQGLNTLMHAERARHAQYRHLLDDLAHTLKTPLSVLQNLADPNKPDSALIREQTSQMQSTIARHVQRAAINSPRQLAPLLPVLPLIDRTSRTLGKLYKEPDISFSIDVAKQFEVRMDEADLYEVLGNILENACKYGARHINISADTERHSLRIDDDGPGFGVDEPSVLTRRGVRADSKTSGTGMGLAAVQQILVSYGGHLDVLHAPGGGARIELVFARHR